jgi:hypothetical protein
MSVRDSSGAVSAERLAVLIFVVVSPMGRQSATRRVAVRSAPGRIPFISRDWYRDGTLTARSGRRGAAYDQFREEDEFAVRGGRTADLLQ